MTEALTLDCLIHEPDGSADNCLIWLHGLGADGYDFAPITPLLRQQLQRPGLRLIYPHAPKLAVTMNGGLVMPAWYDILASSPRRTINRQQFKQAVNAIQQLIEQQLDAGIASENIILAGFSQGGAVAYQAALQYHQPLAALVCLSTYLADAFGIHPANQALPVFIGHGTHDQVVPKFLGEEAHQWLQKKGLNAQWREYPLQHEVSQAELLELAAFIHQRLNS